MKNTILHKPVMVNEVISFLSLKKGYKVLDATVGCGYHAGYILERIKPNGFLIGIDRDKDSLEIARRHLSKFDKIYKLEHANFLDLDKILLKSGIEKVDAALFDLGVSSYQIDKSGRGFSFLRDEFLDMRMDSSGGLRAYDILNRVKREDLERVIRDFGEERYYKRVAGFILEERKKKPINSTGELSSLIEKAVGRRYRTQKIHPATRTFQGLRIAVNDELGNLDKALGKILDFLNIGARLLVISFHSLEDRIVKIRFKEFEKRKKGRIVTKKPLVAEREEIRNNPRSRSAKLRVFERT